MSGIAGPHRYAIVHHRLCPFFMADVKPGTAVAKGLGVNAEAIVAETKVQTPKAGR